MLTINDFKRSLVEEVMSKSNASAKSAWEEVTLFSKTRGFMEVFEQWKKLTSVVLSKQKGPRHILDILRNVILDDQCMNKRT